MMSRRWLIATMAAAACAVAVAAPRAQNQVARAQAYDELLDVNVRDGLVYYRALKGQRGRLDAYVASLAEVALDAESREEQIAFWLNAYNAVVLRTVIDHYPIPQRSRAYPDHSLRQIPGAFEQQAHRIGRRTVTLDQIEQTVLPAFQDPRVYLALGRGAVGGGRLRSEAYDAARLETQLAEAAAECITGARCVDVDRPGNKLKVSAIFSWREKEFVAAYAGRAGSVFAERSPIERAVLAFAEPRLLASEREFVDKNMFKLEYIPFDWSLNDLTGR